MPLFTSLTKFLAEKKKKYVKSLKAADCKASCVDVDLHVEPTKLSLPSPNGEHNFIVSKSFPTVEESHSFIPKTESMDGLVIAEFRGDADYEGCNEHDEIIPMNIYCSSLNLQAQSELASHGSSTNMDNYSSENKIKTTGCITHGMEQTVSWASPVINKSRSSTERSNCHSYNINLSGNDIEDFYHEDHEIVLSTECPQRADHLILQKHSSCKILPPGSMNIWLNLCLWTERNLDKPCASQSLAFVHSTAYEKVGCSSDNHEFTEHPDEKKEMDTKNQRVAFSLQSSSHDRVFSWINNLEQLTSCPDDDDDELCGGKEDDGLAFPHHMEIGEFSANMHSHNTGRTMEEMILANNIIQSLNSFSLVAHFSGVGLKVIPSISAFGSIRSVSLSQNSIVHITPGCLPKNIHTLDLSRNKLSTIEGLRDLTRLRVVNLSYNRISRIGHGLSSCTAIKELYLAGNRISNVEGLHRLPKLAVLDLGFNRITMAKAFCQLVANYSSLSSLNLLGNPIQSNAGDEQIRKAVVSILPHIRYLNKQPVKLHRSREVAANCVAHAVVGDGGWGSRRRPTRRLPQGPGSSANGKNANQSRRKHRH